MKQKKLILMSIAAIISTNIYSCPLTPIDSTPIPIKAPSPKKHLKRSPKCANFFELLLNLNSNGTYSKPTTPTSASPKTPLTRSGEWSSADLALLCIQNDTIHEREEV